MRLTVSEIMAATQARGDIREWASREVSLVTADSRAAGPGALFCCLPGTRADGHDFAAQAVERGATAVLAARELGELSGRAAVLVVPDVLSAMGLLARFWRRRALPVVAALSGSAGKTTAKELLASIAAQMGPCVKNPGNFNNQLGLPLSMLAASETDRLWVLELGISRVGDMEELGAICEPDLAVVHNIGPAHLEGLGDLAGVGRAKAAVFSFVPQGGTCLASRDYPELWDAARAARPDVRGMSTRDESAPYFCRYMGCGRDGQGLYRLVLDGESLDVAAPCQGGHLAENVLAAAASARLLGATSRQIADGIALAELPARRFQVVQAGGFTAIDDTYNANPLSMKAAIEAARAMAGGRQLVLVLGEMGELGREAGESHGELGRFVASVGCRALYFKGAHAGEVSGGLARGGFTGEFLSVADADGFAAHFEKMNLPTGVLLFKGSRSQRMEEFLERFMSMSKEGGR